MRSVLFVCLGNICRSPAAEEVLRHMSTEISPKINVESCGLGDWHIGRLPDERMRESAQKRGYILASRAQRFTKDFLEKFDLILAADKEILHELYRFAEKPDHKAKIHLITHYSPCYKDEEIPDPYYEGESGFERVLDMIEDSCEGLVAELQKLHKKSQ